MEEHARKRAEEAARAGDLQLQLSDTPIPMSEEYLGKVADELIHNAFKFSPPGGAVRVELSKTPDTVALSVSDHGRGFSTEQIARVGAYMQFDRTLHEQQGIGLGLAIARRLTELHGGTLTIQSEKGVGTSVVMRLPKAPPN